MKVIKFKDEAERLKVSPEAIENIFKKSIKSGKVNGIIDSSNQEIITYQPDELTDLAASLSSGKVAVGEIAKDLGLNKNQTGLVIQQLINQEKASGILSKDDFFIPEAIPIETDLNRIVAVPEDSRPSIEPLICPKCGGNLSPNKEVCPYCGVFYLVKSGKVLELMDLAATEDNMKKYIRLVNLRTDHIVTQTQFERIISEREVGQIAFTAKQHLAEELLRQPKIREVDERVQVYFAPIKQKHIEKTVTTNMWIYFVMSVFISLLGLLAWWLTFPRW